MNGHKVVAATISVTFIAMLPIETETILEVRIDRIDGRRSIRRRSSSARQGKPYRKVTGCLSC
jgi:hypothetical protein